MPAGEPDHCKKKILEEKQSLQNSKVECPRLENNVMNKKDGTV